ncbi:uncharacterized protein [Nicotiana sylvestris]|uniref:Uncharacterized protein LOC104240242 n=1 Tax=Nicotiana sylvestris TaxID=4096 RepID=A0A1U7Y264_NICSY|nr:PREDICTED: uncharacterized protein LOC104240242 [Nicotiana sylvestris]XP_016468636.1 PREDICTED: uncharacterized protein LOC107791138 [Nicotiana tabacum]
MGNCLFGGVGDGNEDIVKVITSTGGIMEFLAPITVESITEEFQGHGIFRSHDLFWKPLPAQEVLLAGQSYYLLPLNKEQYSSSNIITENIDNVMAKIEIGHVRSNSVPLPPQIQNLVVAPYRMSFDSQGLLKRSYTEALYRYSNSNSNSRSSHSQRKKRSSGGGFWKVKLVISPKQLLEILSQETATQELIESVRTVAKCGKSGTSSSASSVGFSDQWSLSSSRNASSYKDALFSSD